jgi:hypothetical protein
MDVGKDVTRRKGAGRLEKLSDTVQGMMCQWTEDNFPIFVETMKMIQDKAPVQYVKLYLEAVKMGIVKESNINININRMKDREDLQALVRTKITLPDNYTPYEEVRPRPLPYAEPSPLPQKEEEEP